MEIVVPPAHAADAAAVAVKLPLRQVIVVETARLAEELAELRGAHAALGGDRLAVLARGADHLLHQRSVHLVGDLRVGAAVVPLLVVAVPAEVNVAAAGRHQLHAALVVLAAGRAIGARAGDGRRRGWRGRGLHQPPPARSPIITSGLISAGRSKRPRSRAPPASRPARSPNHYFSLISAAEVNVAAAGRYLPCAARARSHSACSSCRGRPGRGQTSKMLDLNLNGVTNS